MYRHAYFIHWHAKFGVLVSFHVGARDILAAIHISLYFHFLHLNIYKKHNPVVAREQDIQGYLALQRLFPKTSEFLDNSTKCPKFQYFHIQ